MLLFVRCAAAQLIAAKDLSNVADVPASMTESNQSEPATAKSSSDNKEKRDCTIGFKDGVLISEVREKLRLEIVRVDPHVIYRGATLTVIIRLKNVGDKSVLVPWETPPVKPDTDPKTGNTSTEIAGVLLSLTPHEDHRTSSYLKGEAILAASPSNRAQHAELSPGQWVEVKFRTAVECNSSDPVACQGLTAHGRAELAAHWWESLSTHEDDGCNVWRGEYESRRLESEPQRVDFVAASPSDAKKPAPRH